MYEQRGAPPGRTDDVIFTWVNKFIVIGCTLLQTGGCVSAEYTLILKQVRC